MAKKERKSKKSKKVSAEIVETVKAQSKQKAPAPKKLRVQNLMAMKMNLCIIQGSSAETSYIIPKGGSIELYDTPVVRESLRKYIQENVIKIV
jgi:hypothetical protein